MFYRIIKSLAWVLFHLLFSFKVTGRENIPANGAFLFCMNHISALDPIVVAVKMKRQPGFMAKVELFKFKPLGWFLSALGAYPVNRRATDMQAFRTTLEILKKGEGLIIFSQGTRMKEFDNAKGGVALFAIKSGAPIIPAWITSRYRFRSKVEINIGPAISMDEYKGKKIKTELIDEVMGMVIEKVKALGK